MKPKLILVKDTNPTTSGCYSVVQFNYREFRPVVKPYSDKRNIFNIEDEIKILIKDNEIEVLKITWGGLFKEKLFSKPLVEFMEQLSNHPRFENLTDPFPTLLETVTKIALENWETKKFLKSLEGHLIGGKGFKNNL